MIERNKSNRRQAKETFYPVEVRKSAIAVASESDLLFTNTKIHRVASFSKTSRDILNL